MGNNKYKDSNLSAVENNSANIVSAAPLLLNSKHARFDRVAKESSNSRACNVQGNTKYAQVWGSGERGRDSVFQTTSLKQRSYY